MPRPQRDVKKIKYDRQFVRFCDIICREHNTDLDQYRYALQLDRLPKNIPENLNRWMLYMESGFYVLFIRNKHGIGRWLKDYKVLREYYNKRPKNWSRSFSHLQYSKLNDPEYSPQDAGYDRETDIVRDFMKEFNVELQQRDYILTKKV